MITVDFKRLSLQHPDSGHPIRILDVGCGSGRHMGAVLRMEHTLVVGADKEIKDLKKAKEKIGLQESWGEIRGRQGLMAADIARLPFGPKTFDLVICSEVLEHIEDHRHAAQELLRVLKPGGDLVVSVPRYWPERICWRLCKDYGNTPGGHIRIYRTREIVALFRSLGARPWALHYAHGLHTPFWWLKCLVGLERDQAPPIEWYHRFLVWDMMKQPMVTRILESLLNPLLGKSTVVYLRNPMGPD